MEIRRKKSEGFYFFVLPEYEGARGLKYTCKNLSYLGVTSFIMRNEHDYLYHSDTHSAHPFTRNTTIHDDDESVCIHISHKFGSSSSTSSGTQWVSIYRFLTGYSYTLVCRERKTNPADGSAGRSHISLGCIFTTHCIQLGQVVIHDIRPQLTIKSVWSVTISYAMVVKALRRRLEHPQRNHTGPAEA